MVCFEWTATRKHPAQNMGTGALGLASHLHGTAHTAQKKWEPRSKENPHFFHRGGSPASGHSSLLEGNTHHMNRTRFVCQGCCEGLLRGRLLRGRLSLSCASKTAAHSHSPSQPHSDSHSHSRPVPRRSPATDPSRQARRAFGSDPWLSGQASRSAKSSRAGTHGFASCSLTGVVGAASLFLGVAFFFLLGWGGGWRFFFFFGGGCDVALPEFRRAL